jgi:hypothetical protein
MTSQIKDGKLGSAWHTPLFVIVVAGLVGGMAEMAWMMLYSLHAPPGALEVSRQVAFSVFPGVVDSVWAPLLGVFIHLALSIALAAVAAVALWLPLARRFGALAVLPIAIVTLLVVWKINFFVILPIVNPAFVTLMPYGVTLFSKLLFGLAAGSALYYARPVATRQVFERNRS